MHFNTVMPPEVISKSSRLILISTHQLLIEGHKGLLSYDTACIRVRLKEATLTVSGHLLNIPEFAAEDLMIAGDIRSVEFDR